MEERRELLSELLSKRERYIELWSNSETVEEKEIYDLVLDCIECKLMYGNYVNDIGREYDYWNE